jgi:ABC-2 type transport system ATP-binding protein
LGWAQKGAILNAVELVEVRKAFSNVQAVRNLTLTVPEGCVYGFIGPNGSGKSTTLRMIMRIIYPDQGVVRVLGAETFGAANDLVGYLPEERSTYKKMKVREVLCFHAELKGVRRPRALVDDWLERLGLIDWRDKKVETLSKGMAQKVQFISSVVSKPKLLLLDEPFSGLDPVNNETIRNAVIELHREGTTIIFSTHDMRTAEVMCDYIFMIYRGDKVLDGTLESIQNQYGTDMIRVRVDGNAGSIDALKQIRGVADAKDLGHYKELRVADRADTQAILHRLSELGRVLHFEISRPSLHDIFVRIANPTAEESAEWVAPTSQGE